MVSRELERECIVVFDEAHNIDNVCIEALRWAVAKVGSGAALQKQCRWPDIMEAHRTLGRAGWAAPWIVFSRLLSCSAIACVNFSRQPLNPTSFFSAACHFIHGSLLGGLPISTVFC